MLCITALTNERHAHFEFGAPLEPRRSAVEQLRWIAEDYAARYDALWLSPGNDLDPGFAQLLVPETDPATLAGVVRAAGALGGTDYLVPVCALLEQHPDPDVRRACIRALGQMSKATRSPLIEPYLHSPDRALRREAILALGKFTGVQFIPMIQAAAGQDDALRALADEGARKINAIAVQQDVPAYFQILMESDEYEDVLGLMPASMHFVPRLIGLEHSPALRLRVARVVGLGRALPVAKMLLALLMRPEESAEMHRVAIWGLGRCRVQQAVNHLVGLLDHAEQDVQQAVITALGQIGHPRAMRPLLARWDARDGALRGGLRLAARRLCDIAGAELYRDILLDEELDEARAIMPTGRVYTIDETLALSEAVRHDLVEPCLDAEDPAVRLDAAALLAFFGRPEVVPRLEALGQHDPDPAVRRVAERGAAFLARRGPQRLIVLD